MNMLKVSRIQSDIIFILFLPLLLLIINPTWMWLNSTVDTWAYYGYFLNLKEYLNYLQDSPIAYFGSRLPLILVGNLFYYLFPSSIANYALHLFFIYIALYSLYFLLYILFESHNTSVFSTVLLCCNSYFLWAMGWDYVDGPIISYSLLVLLTTIWASRQRQHIYLFVFPGAFLAFLIYTNLFLISLTPAFAYFLYFINRKYYRHSPIKLILYILTGFSLITAVFCVINSIVNNEFLFFMPSIQFTLNNLEISPESNIWLHLSPQSNLIYSHWLNLPIVIFLLSLFYIILSLRKRLFWDPFVFISVFTYLIAFSIMLFCEIRAGNVLTDYSSYFRFLYPQLFLAIGALSNQFLSKTQRREFFMFIALIISFSSLFLFIPGSYQNPLMLCSNFIEMINNVIFIFMVILIISSFSYLCLSRISGVFLKILLFMIGLFFALLGIYLRFSRIDELSKITSLPIYTDIIYIFNWLVFSYYPTVLSLAILLLAIIFRKRVSHSFTLLLIGVNIGFSYTTYDLKLFFPLDHQSSGSWSSIPSIFSSSRQELYNVFSKASNIIHESRFKIDKLFFWYQTSGLWNDFSSHSLNDVYRNIASPYISSGQIINENYPALIGVDLLGRGSVLPTLSPGDVVVVLSQDSVEKNTAALRPLLGIGLKPLIVSSDKVATERYHFNMNFFQADIDRKLFDFSSVTNLTNLKWNIIDTSKPGVINTSHGMLVTTNRSQYDWQLSTELFPAQPNSTYLVEFDRNLIQGGMSFIIGGSPLDSSSYQNHILLNKWRCSRLNSQPEKVQFVFNTKQYNAFRFVLANFGNCKNSIPKISKFEFSHLRYVRMIMRK